MTIKTALLWFVFVDLLLGVFYRLWQVIEGEHTHDQLPEVNAFLAVLDTILAMLWWFYVLH